MKLKGLRNQITIYTQYSRLFPSVYVKRSLPNCLTGQLVTRKVLLYFTSEMRQGHNDRQQQVAIVTFVETFAKFTKCEELIFLLALIPFPFFFFAFLLRLHFGKVMPKINYKNVRGKLCFPRAKGGIGRSISFLRRPSTTRYK